MSNPSPPVQVLVDRYELRATLGRGGMGVVYDGWDRVEERPVAVKVIPALLLMMSADDLQRRFAIEAQACARIEHPHVVRILDSGVGEGGTAYMVMERLYGATLDDLRRDYGRLPVHVAAHVGVQIAEALQAAHDNGVVHRDLKPANIMLVDGEDAPYFVKVLDFGLAKLLDGEDITATGLMMGTPDYIAPELILGERPTPRSDIYSVGVMLYRVITGTRVFRQKSPVPGFHNVNTLPDPMRDRVRDAGIPAALDAVVLRCLAKDAAARFESMAEVADALRPFAVGDLDAPLEVLGVPGVEDDLSPTEARSHGIANISTVIKGGGLVSIETQPIRASAFLPPPSVPSADGPPTALSSAQDLLAPVVDQAALRSEASQTGAPAERSDPGEPPVQLEELPALETSGAFSAQTRLVTAPRASSSMLPRAAAVVVALVAVIALVTLLSKDGEKARAGAPVARETPAPTRAATSEPAVTSSGPTLAAPMASSAEPAKASGATSTSTARPAKRQPQPAIPVEPEVRAVPPVVSAPTPTRVRTQTKREAKRKVRTTPTAKPTSTTTAPPATLEPAFERVRTHE